MNILFVLIGIIPYYGFTILNIIYIYIYIYIVHQPIALVDRVFTNGLGDWGTMSGRVISKIQK